MHLIGLGCWGASARSATVRCCPVPPPPVPHIFTSSEPRQAGTWRGRSPSGNKMCPVCACASLYQYTYQGIIREEGFWRLAGFRAGELCVRTLPYAVCECAPTCISVTTYWR